MGIKEIRMVIMLVILNAVLFGCTSKDDNSTPNNSNKSHSAEALETQYERDDLSDFYGCWLYKDESKTWYIEIREDGTWEQMNEFAESMDEGTCTLEGDKVRLEGEMYSDIYRRDGENLVTEDGIRLTPDEMPVPDMPTVHSGYSLYTGSWYTSADVEPHVLLVFGSDYAWSMHSDATVIMKGSVQNNEEGFDLVKDDGTIIATAYMEEDSSIILNFYSEENPSGLPQTCRLTPEAR